MALSRIASFIPRRQPLALAVLVVVAGVLAAHGVDAQGVDKETLYRHYADYWKAEGTPEEVQEKRRIIVNDLLNVPEPEDVQRQLAARFSQEVGDLGYLKELGESLAEALFICPPGFDAHDSDVDELFRSLTPSQVSMVGEVVEAVSDHDHVSASRIAIGMIGRRDISGLTPELLSEILNEVARRIRFGCEESTEILQKVDAYSERVGMERWRLLAFVEHFDDVNGEKDEGEDDRAPEKPEQVSPLVDFVPFELAFDVESESFFTSLDGSVWVVGPHEPVLSAFVPIADGILHHHASQWRWYPGPLGTNVECLVASKGTLWFLSDGEIVAHPAASIPHFTLKVGEKVESSLITQRGVAFLMDGGRVLLFEQGQWRTPGDPGASRAVKLVEDREDGRLFALFDDGFVKSLNEDSWRVEDAGSIDVDERFVDLAWLGSGRLVGLTHRARLLQWDEGRWEKLYKQGPELKDPATILGEATRGSGVWIAVVPPPPPPAAEDERLFNILNTASDADVFIVRPNGWRPIDAGTIPLDEIVLSPSNTLFFEDYEGYGIREIGAMKPKVRPVLGGIGKILVTSDQSVWILHENGLIRIVDGKEYDMKALSRHMELGFDYLLNVAEDTAGNVWISSDADTLSLFRYARTQATLNVMATDILSDARWVKFLLDVEKGNDSRNWEVHYRFSNSTSGEESKSKTGVEDDWTAQVVLPDWARDELDVSAWAVDHEGNTVYLHGSSQPLNLTIVEKESGPNWLARGVVGHVVFWTCLLILYPWFRPIQSIFFWNSRVRKIAGLWYVDLLLTFPVFGRLILLPFRKELVAEAQLSQFDDAHYYRKSRIQGDGARGDLLDKFRRLRGHVVLIGRSGTGKTHFVRYLLATRRRLSVFLPAGWCEKGVVEAIVGLLPPHVNDQKLIDRMIYSGAIDVYVDGLNEAGSDVRGEVNAFLRKLSKGNVLITTQPTSWSPPGLARRLQLQPLDSSQIVDFLKMRSQGDEDFEKRAADFVTSRLEGDSLDDDEKRRNLEALSVPFDLELAGHLLSMGQAPNLLQLQRHHIELVSERYHQETQETFPMDELAERAYRSRTDDSRRLEADGLDAALLAVLEEERIVVKRTTRRHGSKKGEVDEFFFRHDKPQEYFVLQKMRQDKKLMEKHIVDDRFTGVYLLLAEELDVESARRLRSLMALHAARSQEHGVLDAFILKLEQLGKHEDSF